MFGQLRRAKTVPCAWAGPHTGGAIARVTTAFTCGHLPSTTLTCHSHLVGLLDDGGTSVESTYCAACRCNRYRTVTDTTDV